MIIVYYSPTCPNCTRLLHIVNKVPSLKKRVDIRSVDTMSPAERSGLQYVPTIVDDAGRQHVGTRAFEFLKEYEMEIELDPAPVGMGRLEFASLEGFGENEYMESFGEFTAPP